MTFKVSSKFISDTIVHYQFKLNVWLKWIAMNAFVTKWNKWSCTHMYNALQP